MRKRRWCGVGLGVVCLVMLAGCVPGLRGSQHTPGPESSPPTTPGAMAAADGKSPQAPRAETPAGGLIPPEQAGGAAATYQLAGDDPLLTARITLYQQKKSAWQAAGARLAELAAPVAQPESWNQCRQDIDLALAGYGHLQAGAERDVNPWETVALDMDYFDRDCDRVLLAVLEKTSDAPDLAPVPDSATIEIEQSMARGLYQEAALAYEALPRGEGGALPGSSELKLLYSRALIKLGRLQEATGALTKLMAEINPPIDLVALDSRLLTADLLLAVGQVEDARQVYEGLAKSLAPIETSQGWVAANLAAFSEPTKAEDLAAYRQLLQAYLRFDGQRVPQELIDGVARLQGRQNKSLLALARILLSKATAQSQDWARNQLAAIRGYLAARDLVRARELMQQLAPAAPAVMQPAVLQLETELAQAELAAQESPPTSEPGQAVDPWPLAVSLLEQQKYDEAIVEFQKLVDGEHGAEARAKMAEASDLAAAALRRQAAALYAKAKNTFDPEARRQGFLSSRALLLSLIDKYPESSIVAKARQNLKVLEVELGSTTPSSPPAPNTIVP